MDWGFIWLMFVLKIPIFMMFGIVWWAVRSCDEPAPPEPARLRPHPHRVPPRPSRGRRPRHPHGGDARHLAPARIRPVHAVAARAHRSDRR